MLTLPHLSYRFRRCLFHTATSDTDYLLPRRIAITHFSPDPCGSCAKAFGTRLRRFGEQRRVVSGFRSQHLPRAVEVSAVPAIMEISRSRQLLSTVAPFGLVTEIERDALASGWPAFSCAHSGDGLR